VRIDRGLAVKNFPTFQSGQLNVLRICLTPAEGVEHEFLIPNDNTAVGPEYSAVSLAITMDRALTATHEELIVAGSVKDVYRVRQKMGDGFEGFDGAFGTAGKIYDDGVSANGSDRTR
jgi:hypothetical protein